MQQSEGDEKVTGSCLGHLRDLDGRDGLERVELLAGDVVGGAEWSTLLSCMSQAGPSRLLRPVLLQCDFCWPLVLLSVRCCKEALLRRDAARGALPS